MAKKKSPKRKRETLHSKTKVTSIEGPDIDVVGVISEVCTGDHTIEADFGTIIADNHASVTGAIVGSHGRKKS